MNRLFSQFLFLLFLMGLIAGCNAIRDKLGDHTNPIRPTEGNDGETIGGYAVDVEMTLVSSSTETLSVSGPPGTVRGQKMCISVVDPSFLSVYRTAVLQGNAQSPYIIQSGQTWDSVEVAPDGSFRKDWLIEVLEALSAQHAFWESVLVVFYLPESADGTTVCNNAFQPYLPEEESTAAYFRLPHTAIDEIGQTPIVDRLRTLYEDD